VVGISDFYLLNCDANGNPKWVIKQTSGGQSSEFANAVTNDGTGNLYIAGTFKSSPIAFGTSSISNNKGFDIFLARLGSVATGITGPAESAGYQIFPNPVNDFLHIQLNTGKVKSIEILNMVGKMESISLKSEEGKDIEINTQKLKSGMYMLRIAYDDGIVTKKFVKE